MRNKRILFVLFGAAAFGLVAAVAVSRYLSNAQALTRDMRKVVVAKVDIPLGTKLVNEQLSTVQMPTDATPDGAFESDDKLVGRVVTVQIAAREPVTDFKLAPEGSAAGLSAATGACIGARAIQLTTASVAARASGGIHHRRGRLAPLR